MATKVKKKTPKVVKKKGRRTEIQTPIENADATVEYRKSSGVIRSTVRVGELRPSIEDTTWRVFNEIRPELEGIEGAKANSDELAYVFTLGLVLGWDGQQPRRGQKIRNHEFPSKEVPLCRECR